MESKRCPRCGKMMQKKEYGFFHCRCGNSWMAGKGYFARTPEMECTFEEKIVDGVTVRVPVIKYHEKPHIGERPCQDDILRIERADEEKITAPFERKAREIVRTGIYYIRKHQSTGHEQYSGRPAVIVSDVSEGDFSDVVTVVYLTTQEKRHSWTRTLITSSGRVSTALAEQITTVDVSRVGKFLGICTTQEMQAIKTCIRSHLGMYHSNYKDSAPDDQSDYIRQLEAENKALRSQLREQQSLTWELERKLKK